MDTAWLQTFLDSPSGLALKGLMLGTLITAALGIFAALRDGTFDWKYVDSFVRSTLWGRVAPTAVVLLLAYAFGDATISGTAVLIAAAVGAGLIASGLESLRQLLMPKAESAKVNELPTG